MSVIFPVTIEINLCLSDSVFGILYLYGLIYDNASHISKEIALKYNDFG